MLVHVHAGPEALSTTADSTPQSSSQTEAAHLEHQLEAAAASVGGLHLAAFIRFPPLLND